MSVATRPRLGFLGVGWIGRDRMEAIAHSGAAEVAAICDPALDGSVTFEDLLERDLDGLVIATPSALHAEQATAAIERGLAVFCQKPLARTAAEARRVVDAARAADVLLGVDLSYRHAEAFRVALAEDVGELVAADLVFHNAYGPDKQWFYDPALAGGGCLIDLGIHLVDLALWLLDFPEVTSVDSQLFAKGRPVGGKASVVEDYASVQLRLGDVAVQLTCSWRVSAGRDCVIEASFFGSEGGVALKNENGSFYDFVGERYQGTRTERLASPPDEWGGRAAVAFAARLAERPRFDADPAHLVRVAEVLDAIYDAAEEHAG
jgi:predicted dehydrogenase